MAKSVNNLFILYYRLRRYVNDHKIAHRDKFEELLNVFYENLWENAASKIGAATQKIGYGFIQINLNNNSTFVLNSMVMLDNHLNLKVAGNKPLILRLLSEQNVPIQNYLEYDISSLSKAYKFMDDQGRPCVVKPASSTGAGNGITTKIQSYRKLKRASFIAATFGQKILIEEEISGDSFRLLYLNGQLLDVVRRQSPQVTGNGEDTIKELIEKDNQERLKGDPIVALSPLEIDQDCKLNLKVSGFNLNYVPKNSEKIIVKKVVNQNRSTENESIKESVHPSIISLGENIVNLLNWRLLGIDLITPDITKPLREVGGVVNEINTTPGLHHHYLINNKENIAPVAEYILQNILKR